MNILKNANQNNDRFIAYRTSQSDVQSYFQIKEELEDSDMADEKMVVDSYDEASNNQMVYNALLKSEILDISDNLHSTHNELENENMPTSLTCYQKFSTTRSSGKKQHGLMGVRNDSIFSQ